MTYTWVSKFWGIDASTAPFVLWMPAIMGASSLDADGPNSGFCTLPLPEFPWLTWCVKKTKPLPLTYSLMFAAASDEGCWPCMTSFGWAPSPESLFWLLAPGCCVSYSPYIWNGILADFLFSAELACCRFLLKEIIDYNLQTSNTSIN